MGIDIIENEYTLSNEQKREINQFVFQNCSYYYFLNFIRITKCNVSDAKELYYFDEELRAIILKYLLRLEVQMKKDLIEFVEGKTGDLSFWDNPIHYISNYTSVPIGKTKSGFQITVDKMNVLIAEMKFSAVGPANNRAFYSSTFGNFVTIHKNLLYPLKQDFNDKYLYPTSKSTEKLQKYLFCLKKIRNRCCHSNHVVSLKLKNELNNRNLDPLGVSIALSPFERCLYFIYSRLDCKMNFKQDMLEVLRKYENQWKPYSVNHSIPYNMISNIETLWM